MPTDKGSDQSERVFTDGASQSRRSPSLQPAHVYLHAAAIMIAFITTAARPIFAIPSSWSSTQTKSLSSSR
ncbi:hypothetical protein E2C01_092002 [Portunus trituberculatus]|uniref:Uncharacterized protein n=1 Tax=Portunus trituberculatus TaxID=210409 RepID=A0A5B7JQW7_PORTR|nr:hypothetical protein [Portunus trituberculatus]